MQQSPPVTLLRLRFLLLLLLAPGLVLATEPPDLSRFWVAVWNFGHVVLFWLLAQVILHERALRGSVTPRFVVGLVVTLVVVGALIEALQAWIDRDCEAGDVLADAFGATLGALFSRHWHARGRVGLRWRYILGGMLLMFSAREPLWHAADIWQRWRHFPVLYSADSVLATWARLDRLNVTVSRVGQPAFARQPLLAVDLQPGRYSTLSIDELMGDWRDYDSLVWRWYNPGDPLDITCRVHDRQHVLNDFADDDRFHQRFLLASGWNTLTISLVQVKAAPANRDMDMARIRSLGCHAFGLGASRRVYLDAVYLQAAKAERAG